MEEININLKQELFFNTHCVFQGGRHIDYVVDQIVSKLIEVVKKKNKAGVSVKPFQVTYQRICDCGEFTADMC